MCIKGMIPLLCTNFLSFLLLLRQKYYNKPTKEERTVFNTQFKCRIHHDVNIGVGIAWEKR